ncbi:MAG: phosphoglucosamine mutase, partial [Thermoanaerobaculia bacterium]|nr:phosphoglucosamine mutase [Thermoanaerobaculia bacterium]
GTDGIRGRFGVPPLDEETIRRLGGALARYLTQGSDPAWAVLGGDTRFSTPQIAAWLHHELTAGGVRVTYLGTVPTPAVADVTRRLGAGCGIAVSASHNPAPDNGIKLLDRHGFKWSTGSEAALEGEMASQTPQVGEASPPDVDSQAAATWFDDLGASLEGSTLGGLRIVADAGHGAASPYVERLFRNVGAEIEVHNATPDGRNINHGCGSTHPEVVAGLVTETAADLGLTFDGDADRCLLADATGDRDGDAILFLWATDLLRRGELRGDAVVATSMSNLGLEVALRRHDIGLARCDVGDRHVVETLRSRGLVLGGEQSGHIVHLGLSTTGDGLLTALHVARIVAEAGRSLPELLEGFHRFPQLLLNVSVDHKPDLDTLPRVVESRRDIERTLGDRGRLVLRYSGTEPKVRIMIEGENEAEIHRLAHELAEVLTSAIQESS